MNLKARIAQRIYNFLNVGKSPHPADCIFVLAGKQERKVFGIEMWRFGYTPQLILSVERFEWRKFKELNLESDGGLVSQVAQIPPKKRHFLVHLNRQIASCTPVSKGFLGTHTEALALAAYLNSKPIQSLLVVSSPTHMRRVALAFRRAFRKTRIDLAFVAVPEAISFDTPKSRAEIWTEFRKYLIYTIIF